MECLTAMILFMLAGTLVMVLPEDLKFLPGSVLLTLVLIWIIDQFRHKKDE